MFRFRTRNSAHSCITCAEFFVQNEIRKKVESNNSSDLLLEIPILEHFCN